MGSIADKATIYEEEQYLNLIRTVMESGAHRPDSTDTGTVSILPPPIKIFTHGRDSTTFDYKTRFFYAVLLKSSFGSSKVRLTASYFPREAWRYGNGSWKNIVWGMGERVI